MSAFSTSPTRRKWSGQQLGLLLLGIIGSFIRPDGKDARDGELLVGGY